MSLYFLISWAKNFLYWQKIGFENFERLFFWSMPIYFTFTRIGIQSRPNLRKREGQTKSLGNLARQSGVIYFHRKTLRL